ncbi:MAG: glycosyltransferase [Cyanobacteria bacterium P01_A01_bin.83]
MVDVSAEITQYLRFLGVPVIAVRQHGDRSDLPHLCGYDAAYKLFAPFPEILEFAGVPSWIRDKTIYTPGFSRYSLRHSTKTTARDKLNLDQQQQIVVVVNGKGGGQYSLGKIAAAATATPQWQWLILGEVARDLDHLPQNISVLGWCEDTYIYLKAADVAIAHGGHNTVMEIGTARVPFLCIPESRPFNEQQIKAELLAKLGLCYLANGFPHQNQILDLLNQLKTIDVSQWQDIMADDGAIQAAKAIESEVKLLASYQNSWNHDVA